MRFLPFFTDMTLDNNQQRLQQKILLFEYFVYLLEQWKTDIKGHSIPSFTKLRLQKLLFLACTINATVEEKRLMCVFNRFSALPYGPVELDIYQAMNGNSFTYLLFEGNDCRFKQQPETGSFDNIDGQYLEWMDDAINELKQKRMDYLYMPVFDIVDITHQWTAWQTAITVAELLGSKSEEMTVEDICNSNVKAY